MVVVVVVPEVAEGAADPALWETTLAHIWSGSSNKRSRRRRR